MDCFNKECPINLISKHSCTFPEEVRKKGCTMRMSHPPKPKKIEADKWIDAWNKAPEKSVSVYYWYKDWSDRTGYENGGVYPYEELHEMIDHVMSCGLKVMLLHQDGGVTLAIDDQRFSQR